MLTMISPHSPKNGHSKSLGVYKGLQMRFGSLTDVLECPKVTASPACATTPNTVSNLEFNPKSHQVESQEYSKKRKLAQVDNSAKRHKQSEVFCAQGYSLLKSSSILQSPSELGTIDNEFVGPEALVQSVRHWNSKEVFGKGTKKRWSTRTIHEYFRLYPETCANLLSLCYHPNYVSEPQKYIDFCDNLVGLRKMRKPEKDGKWLERDTQWYSFVDKEGFSTVYRGGSIDYSIPKKVKHDQFKMDANFADILPTVRPLLEKIQMDFGEQPNHCVITRYNRTYDGIRCHTDKTKDLVRGSSIFVFTFGAEKTFEVVHQRRMAKASDNPEHYQEYRKGKSKRAAVVARWKPISGSLIRMTWDMNQVFEHGVPVRAKPTDSTFQRERETTTKYDMEAPRYSITFRSKCTWYQPEEGTTFVDPKWQLSSLQPGGAVRIVLENKN